MSAVYRDPFKWTSWKTHTMRTGTALHCFTVSRVWDSIVFEGRYTLALFLYIGVVFTRYLYGKLGTISVI